jgi:outer membrane protein insertion porin family
MFPVTASDAVRAVVFCDFGTVERSLRFDADTFRVSPGFGLRFNIPAMGPAPIAVDFAVPVHSAPGDDIQNISVFVGFGR